MELTDFTKKEYVGKAKEVSIDGDRWAAQEMQAQSKTNIESDEGIGGAAIIRMFEFKVNSESFRQHKPTKQELFNAHAKGIEILLWRDGMQIMHDVEPRVVMGNNRYRIFVGARPAKGHLLKERPQTLTEIVHGKS